VVSFSDTLTAAPHLHPKLSFDPVKELHSGDTTLAQPVVLAAHPSLGVKSLVELIALAKAKPGIPYATSGAGSQQHIVAEWFASLAGIKLTHVPYKGGGRRSAISLQARCRCLTRLCATASALQGGQDHAARTEHAFPRADITYRADVRGGGHQGARS